MKGDEIREKQQDSVVYIVGGDLCWVAGVMGEFVTWYDFTSEMAGMQRAA